MIAHFFVEHTISSIYLKECKRKAKIFIYLFLAYFINKIERSVLLEIMVNFLYSIYSSSINVYIHVYKLITVTYGTFITFSDNYSQG